MHGGLWSATILGAALTGGAAAHVTTAPPITCRDHDFNSCMGRPAEDVRAELARLPGIAFVLAVGSTPPGIRGPSDRALVFTQEGLVKRIWCG